MTVVPQSNIVTLEEAAALSQPPVIGGGRRQGYVGVNSATVAVLATSYFFQSAAAQRSLKSLSANDTSDGTGARKVRITYYDANMDGPFTEDVTLNGETAVATQATNIRHVEKLEVIEAGATGGNEGTIQMFDDAAGAGGLITSLAAQDNRTYHAQHFVAQDRVCFVSEAQVGSELNPGKMLLNVQNPNDPVSPQQNLDISFPYPGQDTLTVPFRSPIRVEGPARIWMSVRPLTTGADTVHGVFGFFETSK